MQKILMTLLLVCFSFPVMAQLDRTDQNRESAYDYYDRLRQEDKRDDYKIFEERYDDPFDVPSTSKDDRYQKLKRGTSNDLSYERGKQNKSSGSVLQDLLSQ